MDMISRRSEPAESCLCQVFKSSVWRFVDPTWGRGGGGGGLRSSE